MSNYLNELNGIQRKAVTHGEGPVLIVAGPGSGKTRVLTYRIAHLIKTGVKPWEILALTFTNKAAREMKERISKVVGEAANQVWAGTFHSIFARMLRVEAEKLGYPSSFTIYDSDDSLGVISSILREQNLDRKIYPPKIVRSRISSAKTNIITPKAYEDNAQLRQEDNAAKRPYFYQIYQMYAARCKRAGAMDFDDLLYQMFRLLYQNPDNVAEKYRKKFKYVLVDEFQDTNYLQYEIIKKFVKYKDSPQNINVVGDDAQSIYAFRGATIQNILDFEQDFKGQTTYKLEQNYRSTHHIVQAANAVISNNKRQIPKEIWTNKPPSDSAHIKVIKAMTDAEEGKRIAATILEQKNRYHYFNKDIAILYRTNAQSRVFEEFLRHQNISYKVFGGMSFYQRKEIKDVLGYLRLIINPADEEALRRVINYPKRGIGKTTVDKISQIADAANRTMWETMLTANVSKRATNALVDFVKMIKSFQKKLESSNAYELAIQVLKKSGMIDLLKADHTQEGMSRNENVQALLDGIKNFVENDELAIGETASDKSLASYLASIALYTDADSSDNNDDYVTLMSVHAAKGLEFKSVFVVGVEEDLFPSFMAGKTMEGLDEERRLFYVAITRAEEMLTLSYTASRYRFGQMRYNEVSRFLEEIPVQHLEEYSPVRQAQQTRSRVIGVVPKKAPVLFPPMDIKDFKASPSSEIQAGMKVLHQRFGEGKVLNIDGKGENRVATIFFQNAEEKRIMLKFAKLMIVTSEKTA